jgi:membrane-associated phospholipid phosphatase
MEPPRSALHLGAVRRAAFLYFITWVIGAQIVFVLLSLGAALSSTEAMLWLIFGLWPLATTAAVLVRSPTRPVGEPRRELLAWTIAGLAAYGYWAGSYYFVAWAVDPARIHYLPEIIEAGVPLAPAWSLVYIGVHPFSVTPSLGLTDAHLLRRHVIGQAAVVALSSLAWAAYPVAVHRVEMPAVPPDFGAWVLASIYGRDPIVNCLPSTHCAMALYTASALRRVDKRLGLWAAVTAAAIGASTLFTKEHYLVDVIAGYALGGAAALIAHRERSTPADERGAHR